MRTYRVCDLAGDVQALHERHDLPGGKDMSWRSPDGSYGLHGRRVDSLPLYGSERVHAWSGDSWIVVCEGESDTDALHALNVPALGTVTGATLKADRTYTAPSADALADVAKGRRFVTWPDNDAVGRGHMAAVAENLYRAGALAVRTVSYRPESVDWPKGAGARDLIGTADPMSGAFMVAWLLEEWTLPVGRPGPLLTVAAPPPERGTWDPGSVSAALIARGVMNARPGRTVRCPQHEDRAASLSILADDRRAICKAACEWSGRGVIAADVLVTA